MLARKVSADYTLGPLIIPWEKAESPLLGQGRLDCCIYGSARAALDGKPFGPLLHGSSPGFRHHVLHAQVTLTLTLALSLALTHQGVIAPNPPRCDGAT